MAGRCYTIKGTPVRCRIVQALDGVCMAACRANGSIRYEWDWPSNSGMQRFLWPLIWVRAPALAFACS